MFGTSSPQPALGAWRVLLARLREAAARVVPLGYEDEAGFHYGAEPAGFIRQSAMPETRRDRATDETFAF